VRLTIDTSRYPGDTVLSSTSIQILNVLHAADVLSVSESTPSRLPKKIGGFDDVEGHGSGLRSDQGPVI
jgi:hypothetical protein